MVSKNRIILSHHTNLAASRLLYREGTLPHKYNNNNNKNILERGRHWKPRNSTRIEDQGTTIHVKGSESPSDFIKRKQNLVLQPAYPQNPNRPIKLIYMVLRIYNH